MNTEDIITGLSQYEVGTFPKAVLEAAISSQETVTPILLEQLQEVADLGDDLPKDRNVTLVFFAAYLLAQFREPRALPIMLKMVAASPKTVSRLLGYVISESLARIMASMASSSGENALEAMQPLIEGEEVHPQVRYAALSALVILAYHGQLSSEDLKRYFHSLYSTGLVREQNAVWDGLVFNSAVAGFSEFEQEALKAHEDGLLVETMQRSDNLKVMLNEHPGEIKAPAYKDLSYIDDLIGELQNWAAFRSTPAKAEMVGASSSHASNIQRVSRPWPAKKPVQSKRPIGQKQAILKPSMQKQKQPLVREGVKVGRNDPCPCGSDRKFKKCCG